MRSNHMRPLSFHTQCERDDEGTYKYVQQFLGGQVLVFIFVVEFVIANPLFFILGMSLLLRHFEVPYISRVV